MGKLTSSSPRDLLLDAAETVAAREGVSKLTFDAVAAEAGVSKGGLLHYFTNKEQLIEAMVRRAADGWRHHFTTSYENAEPGPGRMVRGLLQGCFTDAQSWTEELRRSFSSVFAALAMNPELVKPMQEAYQELYAYLQADGLPDGVAETLATAIDGLWLYWVLRLRPVCQADLDRMRAVLEGALGRAIERSKNGEPETTTHQKP
ncbi:TetR/AcrR family transcriptional regulator [Luteolibacter flavescens]|uniref:TetR/AcrR family transcriptional regulator n=1 Tax=Luteolibacter flavescens TaxID=1859460 RepID=A0ABT3FQ95_9BACT|nr:TetR/AcrR family transcriptional regulator [Luteolibacter flavescens]MCW1885737.1 TetR/AcrR family transcriptional regulator [Luteolibacter flavescens]